MNQIEKTLADVAVQHQRIPMNLPGGEHQCSGCDHLRGEPDGPNSPRHAAHVAAEQMKAITALAQTAEPRKHGKTATSSRLPMHPALAPLQARIEYFRGFGQASLSPSSRELYRAVASSLSNDLAEINQNLLPTIPPGPCWNDSGVTWPNGERPRCELLAGHDGAHTWKRPLGGEAVWTDADADSELAQLHRWKQEALPVIAGLQDLGRALDLRPGENITGPKAVEAATAMRTELTRLQEEREAPAATAEPADGLHRTEPYRDPTLIPEYDEDGDPIPGTLTAGWDISFGCRINFGPSPDGDLQADVHVSDQAVRAGLAITPTTTDQLRALAAHLIAVADEQEELR